MALKGVGTGIDFAIERFADLARRSEAAAALECQARLWGGALSWASHQQWGRPADALDELEVLEEEVTLTL